jgi:hypothetical protein
MPEDRAEWSGGGGRAADVLAPPTVPTTASSGRERDPTAAGSASIAPQNSRFAPGVAIVRHPLRTAVPIVVLLIMAAAVSFARQPVYTSEEQLLVGTFDVTANAVPGYVLASQQLASSYARLASADAVISPAAQKLHMSPAELTSHISATNVVQAPQVTLDATASSQSQAKLIATAVSDSLINYVNTLTNNKTVINQIQTSYQNASAALQKVLQAQNDLLFRLGQLRDPRSALYQSLTPAALAHATTDTENQLVAIGIQVDAARIQTDSLDRQYTQAQQGFAEPQGLQAIGNPAALGSDRNKFLGIACAVGLVLGGFVGVGWASIADGKRRRRAGATA